MQMTSLGRARCEQNKEEVSGQKERARERERRDKDDELGKRALSDIKGLGLG